MPPSSASKPYSNETSTRCWGSTPDGCRRHANPSADQLAGEPTSRRFGRSRFEVVPSAHDDELRAALRAALDGRLREDAMVLSLGQDPSRDVSLVLLPTIVDDEFTGVFALARDVTEECVLEEQLRCQAQHDALSGLSTRTALRRRMNAALDAGRAFGLLFPDLDGVQASQPHARSGCRRRGHGRRRRAAASRGA